MIQSIDDDDLHQRCKRSREDFERRMQHMKDLEEAFYNDIQKMEDMKFLQDRGWKKDKVLFNPAHGFDFIIHPAMKIAFSISSAIKIVEAEDNYTLKKTYRQKSLF